MEKREKAVRIISGLLLVLTLLWLVLMIASMARINAAWGRQDYIRWVSAPDAVFVLSYVNVSLLTAATVLLFSLLYAFLSAGHGGAAAAGFAFVPVYGLLNLVCYSTQITVVPALARQAMDDAGMAGMVYQLIQADSRTFIGYLNGLAYAALGIPSIIYGYLLMKEAKKYSGLFLLLNGVSCIMGIAGYMSGIKALAMGTMIGGVLYMAALGCMMAEFREHTN